MEKLPTKYFISFPNSIKSWLIIKENMMENAKQLFKNSGIKLTSSGKRHLGTVIGSTDFPRMYVSDIIENWTKKIELLSDIAKSEPHILHTLHSSMVGSINSFT